MMRGLVFAIPAGFILWVGLILLAAWLSPLQRATVVFGIGVALALYACSAVEQWWLRRRLCLNGHELTPENTYGSRRGRQCITCDNARQRRRRTAA